MFIEFIILSIVIGLIRGGKFSNLFKVNFKKMWLLIAALIIQYLLIVINFMDEVNYIDKLFRYMNKLAIISYVLLLIGIIMNLRYKSLWVVLGGAILNFTVMAANNWKRPILLEGIGLEGFERFHRLLEQGNLPLYTTITHGTKLSVLGDIIIVPKPYPYPHIFSIGDLIISLGLFTLIQEIMFFGNKYSGSRYNYIGRI